ncbi:hypothetical protein ACHAWF_013519 [Thalassiosira exigua]
MDGRWHEAGFDFGAALALVSAPPEGPLSSPPSEFIPPRPISAPRPAGRRRAPRPRLRVRLLRIQDAGKILPAQAARPDRRAAAAHAHARGRGHPPGRRRPRPGDLQPPQPEVLHPRDPHALQRRHAQPPDVQLLPHLRQVRLHRRHLRHPQELRGHQQVRRRHRDEHHQRPRLPVLHPRDQRDEQRHRAHAPRLQQHGAVRRPGRGEAQGIDRRVHRAVARRHLRLPRLAQEPRERDGARPRPLLRALDPRLVHEARPSRRAVDAHVSQRVSRPRHQVGRRVRGALRTVREGGQRPQDHQGPAALVRRPRLTGRDRHALHALQGPLQPQVQPAQPRDHQVLQPLHRDRGVHRPRRGRGVQLGVDQLVQVREGGRRLRRRGIVRLGEAAVHRGSGDEELESGHRSQLLPRGGGEAEQLPPSSDRDRGAGAGGRVPDLEFAVRERGGAEAVSRRADKGGRAM